MGTVQEQRIKVGSKVMRGTDGNGGTEASVICQQCRHPLEEWEAGFCEGCGDMTKCKRCGQPPEDAVRFGTRKAEVYFMKCTCSECGESLEGYEETLCSNCLENANVDVE